LSESTNRAANAIRRLQEKADKIMGAPDQATRQKDAAFATNWTKELCKAMLYTQENDCMPDGSIQHQQLQVNWTKAAFPTRKSLTGGILNPKILADILKKPLQLNDASDWYASTTSENANNWNASSTLDNRVNDPFAEITDIEYECAVAEHKHLGRPLEDVPLNPEQRESGRHVLKVAPSTHTPVLKHDFAILTHGTPNFTLRLMITLYSHPSLSPFLRGSNAQKGAQIAGGNDANNDGGNATIRLASNHNDDRLE
jgi:hypothetical protein